MGMFLTGVASSIAGNIATGDTPGQQIAGQQEHTCAHCGHPHAIHTDIHKLVHLLVEMRDHFHAERNAPIDERFTLQPGTLLMLKTHERAYTMLFAPTSLPVIFQVMGVGTTTTLTLNAGWNALNLPDGTHFGLPANAPGNVSVLIRASNVLYGETINDSLATPDVTESNISNAIRNGQGFTANGRGASGAINLSHCALSVFNPAGSGKTLLLYSWRVLAATGGTLSWWGFTTNDPSGTAGYTTPVTPTHLPGSTAPTSVASCCQTPTGNITTVTNIARTEEFIPPSGTSFELLAPGSLLEVPPGNGVAVLLFVSASGGYFQSAAKWVEL